MKAHAFVHAYPGPRKVVRPLEISVYCIHCYRTLGTADTPERRLQLQHDHVCVETMIPQTPGPSEMAAD